MTNRARYPIGDPDGESPWDALGSREAPTAEELRAARRAMMGSRATQGLTGNFTRSPEDQAHLDALMAEQRARVRAAAIEDGEEPAIIDAILRAQQERRGRRR